MSYDDSWGEAFEYDSITKKPIDEQIQATFAYVQTHEDILRRIHDANTSSLENFGEHSMRKPIQFFNDTMERVLPQDLIPAQMNDEFRKIIIILTFLSEEISQLCEVAQSRFYRPLAMFGQIPMEGEGITETVDIEEPGIKETMIGKFLPLLQDLSNFIERCNNVVKNFLQQLAALTNPTSSTCRASFINSHIISSYTKLAELLSVLIIIDTIIQQNHSLSSSWDSFKSMIAFARNDSESFGTNTDSISEYEALVISIEQKVMSQNIFLNCIEQDFEEATDLNDQVITFQIRNNNTFLDSHLIFSAKIILDNCLPLIGTNNETNERLIVTGCLGIYALYRRLLPANRPPDAKLHRIIWSVQKILPVVIFSDSTVFKVGQFLTTYANFEMKKLDPPNPDAFINQFLTTNTQALSRKTQSLIAQAKAWMVLAESRIMPFLIHESSDNLPKLLDLYWSIISKGLTLANRCNFLCQWTLLVHTDLQIPMSRSDLNDVTSLLETLKAMELTFVRKDQIISQFSSHMIHYLQEKINNITQPIRMKLETSNKLDQSQANCLGLLLTLEHLIKGTEIYSPLRQGLLSLIVDLLTSNQSITRQFRDLSSSLSFAVKNIILISNYNKCLLTSFNTSYMYHHIDLISPFLASIYNNPVECNRLQYYYRVFEDGIYLCNAVNHYDVTPFCFNYRTILVNLLKQEIIQPLCRDIENDLRLHIHTKHLDHMAVINPKTENLKPLRYFLSLSNIHILGLIINIKHEVSHYLDMNFYNLTTVALHDWRTYADMRSLALEKYNLKLMDNFLPMGSLDQGLDVLQIMRNIHIFVSRFNYNMNMQEFIEFRPDKASKHLNTIKIQSIAASIRQHGLGVLNTTVNFTYQFLTSKFHIFSQFLFDDYIRAHLSREHRWYKKNKNNEDVNNRYPYDRALKFVKDIRKLGVNEQGKSFLDQFRILITEIGNALGYVRMVRSASMYYCSEAIKYLPEVDDLISFAQYAGDGKKKKAPEEKKEGEEEKKEAEEENEDVEGANLSEGTIRAAKNLDDVINTIVKNFGEGSDYFKILVKVFQSVLLNNEHDHLKYFYLIVPSLCISWIDASLLAKDSMLKSGRTLAREMYFTDDGFAMGVAYCLAILKQTKRNEALHWDETMSDKLKVDLKNLQEQQSKRAIKDAEIAKKKEEAEAAQRKKSSFFSFGRRQENKEEKEEEDYEDQEEIHSLQLTSKKLEATRRETEQLLYSMSGAEIFFKRTDNDT